MDLWRAAILSPCQPQAREPPPPPCHFEKSGYAPAARGVLKFELDRGVPLEPQNPYPSLRVILAKKGTHS